jgi:hypothetical protein
MSNIFKNKVKMIVLNNIISISNKDKSKNNIKVSLKV